MKVRTAHPTDLNCVPQRTLHLGCSLPQGTFSRLAAIHLVPQGTLSRLAAIHFVSPSGDSP